MKPLLLKLRKLFFILTYILFILATIVFAVLFFIRQKQYNDLNNLYSQTQDNLNKNSTENQVTINNLQQSFNDLNTEVSRLKSENKTLTDQVSKQAKEGYGEISGKISGTVIGDSNVSQYQQVCAENTSNKSLQYCINVSAISQNYTLIVPAGTYQITARVLDKDNKVTLANYKGFYTEYIKCGNDKPLSECDPKLSNTIVNIEIKAGQKASNINPIEWKNV